jgi:hypothetical protein
MTTSLTDSPSGFLIPGSKHQTSQLIDASSQIIPPGIHYSHGYREPSYINEHQHTSLNLFYDGAVSKRQPRFCCLKCYPD